MIVTETRLKHLMSVAHHGHFGVAATSLGISQPALTKSIQGLEAGLGVKLLDRERAGVVLTAFGDLVLQHGRELLRGHSELLRNLRSLAELDIGLVKALLGPFPGVISGYPAAGRLLASHPKLKVSLHIADWREARRSVTEEQVDFGVAELSQVESDARFEIAMLGQHTGYIFCRPEHPLLAKRSIQFSDLHHFPWACTRLPPRIASKFPRDPCAAGHVDPENGDFVPSVEINVPINLGGFAIGTDVLVPAPLALVEAEINARTVSALPGFTLHTAYGFIWPKARSLSPAALAYMAEIRLVEAQFTRHNDHLAVVHKDLIAPLPA